MVACAAEAVGALGLGMHISIPTAGCGAYQSVLLWSLASCWFTPSRGGGAQQTAPCLRGTREPCCALPCLLLWDTPAQTLAYVGSTVCWRQFQVDPLCLDVSGDVLEPVGLKFHHDAAVF